MPSSRARRLPLAAPDGGPVTVSTLAEARFFAEGGWRDQIYAVGITPAKLAEAYGYGVFSARTGNVYTAAQLRLLAELAAGAADPDAIETWPDGPRVRDSLRPAIEPTGFASEAEARLSRRSMVAVATFMTTAVLTVLVTRYLGGL